MGEHTDLRGQYVRDKVTGFEGTAIGRILMMSGTVQYSVQPKVKADDPGKIGEAWCFDRAILEPLHEVVAPSPLDSYSLKLGDKVEHLPSGVKGTVICIVEHLNGCVTLEVQPHLLSGATKNEKPGIIASDHKQYRLIPDAAPVVVEKRDTGCAPRRDTSQRRG